MEKTDRPIIEGWTIPRRGSKAYNLWRGIRKHFHDNGLDASFDMKQVAYDYGLVCPTCGQRDPVCTDLPKRMRDAFVDFVNYYWEKPELVELRANGHSDPLILRVLLEWVASGSECFPIVHDPDADAWMMMNLDSFARLREMRAGAIVSEIHHKSEEMKAMLGFFSRYLPGKFMKKKVLRDGSFLELPGESE